MSVALRNKIKSKKAKVAVVGLGYVGLPLAVNFAKAGFQVYGIDKSQERINKIISKKSYILDVSTKEITKVVNNGRFQVSTEFDVLRDADAILICVPTPLKRKYTPDVSYITSAIRSINKYLKKSALIILESTTYPGTTEEFILPELQKNRRKVDRDFYLSFSPERIDPGNKKYDVTRIPKVVGGVTKQSGHLTKLLYEKIIKQVHLVSSAKAAEMTKLLENSFRIINIGWINEVAMMCNKLEIDVWEVIEAAKTKPFGFMPFYPGLGVGGHCIPDDPLYLYWKAKLHGFSSRYIKLSADTNTHMVDYLVDRLGQILKVKKKSWSKSKILVVGVTYKKDVKDLRKSPPLRLIELLKAKKCKVDYLDPIIPFLDIRGIKLKSVALKKSVLSKYDCVVIATDHTRLNYKNILNYSRLILDVRNVYGNKENKKVIKF